MTYSRLDLLQHETPYELFNDDEAGDTFAEHQKILDQELSEEEQRAFAIKLVSDCPQAKLKDLKNAAQALYSPVQEDSCFYLVLNDALQVKIRLLNILDNENTQPHVFLLEEATPGLLHCFKSLACDVLEKNEIAIAERLALLTPERDRSKLAGTIHNIFKGSALATEVNAAFTLRRHLGQLLGETPEKFFISKDFNRDHCLKFSSMLSKLLDGHEAEIGSKLSKIDHEVQDKIKLKLELLTSFAHNSTDPFHLITDRMEALSAIKAKRISIGTNGNSLYGSVASPSTTAITSPSQDTPSINNSL